MTRRGATSGSYLEVVEDYLSSADSTPLLLHGDAAAVLTDLPSESIDCVMTSPPYWGQRKYASEGVGREPRHQEYIDSLLDIFVRTKRVLKPTGSFWLNLGDAYSKKLLLGLPWRVAIALIDEQGWILRNEVIWNKVKGGLDNTKDRLRTVHEPLFHFVKQARGYFYDVDAIRSRPRQARVVKGAVVSATGVTGVRYRRQIELSTALTPAEQGAALEALDAILADVAAGRLADFRMIIRGNQRATHSDAVEVSGRARELEQRGFYFLRYHPKGSKPSDVWDIIPEDSQNRKGHFAPYPEDLCRIPILATCPAGGVVLDPFCGTGTTNNVARELGRKSIGIDTSSEYLEVARSRFRE